MFLVPLLQISLEGADTLATGAAEESVSLLDLLLNGGFAMIPLALLSVAAVYILIERYLSLQRASRDPEAFMDEVKRMVLDGDVQGAQVVCSQYDSPIARMIEKGLTRIGSPLKNIEAAIENVGKIEIYQLERNLPTLATISGAAPMIGFFGTVTGMIQAFIAIAQEEGSVSPKLLSSGIYQAMITTAVGLAIGIVAYISYNYLVSKVSKIIHQMEYNSIEFIDLLQEPR
ncbi:MAG: MotA/TolQ/ExbB proton channel family protein [Catalinimonas sp.]